MKRSMTFAIGITLLSLAGVTASAGEDEDALLGELSRSPHKVLCERYVGQNWELFLLSADGSGERNLTQTPAIHELYPQAAPDGSKICFLADVEKDGDTLRNVYYMNADGTDRKLVAEKARQPCWSPDSKQIAFVKQEFDRFNILDFASKGLYFYDLATGETSKHPNDAIEHLYNLTWAANGDWIVATVHGGMGFSHNILAIEVDGELVCNLKVPGCRPCISPAGNRMTWSPGDHQINVAVLDFSGECPRLRHIRPLVKDPVLHLYHPDYSPDGKYITYSVGPGGRMPRKGPGTHVQVAEMVGVAGPWNLFLKRNDGEGPSIQLTHDAALSSKESEWLPVLGTRQATQ